MPTYPVPGDTFGTSSCFSYPCGITSEEECVVFFQMNCSSLGYRALGWCAPDKIVVLLAWLQGLARLIVQLYTADRSQQHPQRDRDYRRLAFGLAIITRESPSGYFLVK